MRRAFGLVAAAIAVSGAQAAEEPAPSLGGAAAPADTAADSSMATPPGPAAGDTAAAPADTAVADSTAVEFTPFRPDSTAAELRTFRIERSADVERIAFGLPDDPYSPPGLQTLADQLRLSPAVRTRELSQGPTAETVALSGGASGRTDVILGSRSTLVPATSGPHTHEVMLSEIDGMRIVRGGAAALYGPDAASGAVILAPAFPIADELLTRAFAEEGVDDYQRAGFQASRHLGRNAGVFLTTESRRIDGFFPGTKQVDRHFAGRVTGRLPWGLEGEAGYRRYEGDGRFGGFAVPEIGSVLAKRTDWHATLFRPGAEGRGTLLEAQLLSERLENLGPDGTTKREITAPLVRVTADLPAWLGWEWVTRMEGTRWRFERETGVDKFWRGAAALRATRRIGPGAGFTGTVRLDGEEERRRAVQARTEAWWTAGALRLFAIGSRNERFADRGAVGPNEIHHAGEAGMTLRRAQVEARVAVFGSAISDRRPEPTFEQIRAREPVTDAPVGDARIGGASAGLSTGSLAVPGLSVLGQLRLRTSFTWQDARDPDADERLPRRPARTWTGEGFLERPLFAGELLARVGGRLTHWGDRLDEVGDPVIDMWLTDVLLEGEIGDAVFFYRFHDMLERADEVEPGIRFPGFSRTYGVSWRFRG